MSIDRRPKPNASHEVEAADLEKWIDRLVDERINSSGKRRIEDVAVDDRSTKKVKLSGNVFNELFVDEFAFRVRERDRDFARRQQRGEDMLKQQPKLFLDTISVLLQMLRFQSDSAADSMADSAASSSPLKETGCASSSLAVPTTPTEDAVQYDDLARHPKRARKVINYAEPFFSNDETDSEFLPSIAQTHRPIKDFKQRLKSSKIEAKVSRGKTMSHSTQSALTVAASPPLDDTIHFIPKPAPKKFSLIAVLKFEAETLKQITTALEDRVDGQAETESPLGAGWDDDTDIVSIDDNAANENARVLITMRNPSEDPDEVAAERAQREAAEALTMLASQPVATHSSAHLTRESFLRGGNVEDEDLAAAFALQDLAASDDAFSVSEATRSTLAAKPMQYEHPTAAVSNQRSTGGKSLRIDTAEGFMPSAENNWKFKYDSPSGKTSKQLDQLLTPPVRPKVAPVDQNIWVPLSYKTLGDLPPAGLADKLVKKMEKAEAEDKRQVWDFVSFVRKSQNTEQRAVLTHDACGPGVCALLHDNCPKSREMIDRRARNQQQLDEWAAELDEI
jgi:hypothetical protein